MAGEVFSSPCPSCAGKVPEDTVWIHRGRFYCSEDCVRRAAGIK